MKRGEVWRINLDPAIGSEVRKARPCVIVNNNSVGILPLKIIVPLTEWNEGYAKAAWLIPIESTAANGLSKKSAADTFQVRSISEKRLIKKLGDLSEEELAAITRGLAISLDIS